MLQRPGALGPGAPAHALARERVLPEALEVGVGGVEVRLEAPGEAARREALERARRIRGVVGVLGDALHLTVAPPQLGQALDGDGELLRGVRQDVGEEDVSPEIDERGRLCAVEEERERERSGDDGAASHGLLLHAAGRIGRSRPTTPCG